MSFVLIVEPEEVNAARIRSIFESVDRSFDYELVDSAEKGINVLESRETDVFIADMQMPVMSGAELFSMVEMMSPDTVRIVMSDGGKINETIAFMNECRTFKIILKPCRVADDLFTPIHAALKYKQQCMQAQQESDKEADDRAKRQQEYMKIEQLWKQKLRNYQRIHDVFYEMLECNLSLATYETKIQERLKRWYQWMMDEYVNVVLCGNGDYAETVRSLTASFHDPKHGCIFQMKKTSEEPIDPEYMNEITYILKLVAAVCKDLQNVYNIAAIIEVTDKAYILRLRYLMDRDEQGNENVRVQRVRSADLRAALAQATQIGIQSFGYKTVKMVKEKEDIWNMAIPRHNN